MATGSLFSFVVSMMERHNVSVGSILRCDPSYSNQFICLILAAIAMELLTHVLKRSITFILANFAPQELKNGFLKEVIGNVKSEQMRHYVFSSFRNWIKKLGVEHDPEEEIENLLQANEHSWDKAVDAYMGSKCTKKFWSDFVLVERGADLSKNMQHLISGLLGLWAAMFSSDQPTFLTVTRWAVLLESGWELTDIFKNALYPLIAGNEFNFNTIVLLLHHTTLYVCIPMNTVLLPSEYLGRDLALAMFLYGGLPGLCGPIRIIKSNADVTTKTGLYTFVACQILVALAWVPTRGPHWIYLAYKMMNFAWGEGWVSWSTFLLYVFVVTAFTLFNCFMIMFCCKGTIKAFKQVKKSSATMEDRDGPKKKRTSPTRPSVIDVLIQEISIPDAEGPSSTNRLSSISKMSARRFTLMGIDYELDDEELKQTKARRRTMRKSRATMFAAMTQFRMGEEGLKSD